MQENFKGISLDMNSLSRHRSRIGNFTKKFPTRNKLDEIKDICKELHQY
jgi:hypothetical protein